MLKDKKKLKKKKKKRLIKKKKEVRLRDEKFSLFSLGHENLQRFVVGTFEHNLVVFVDLKRQD